MELLDHLIAIAESPAFFQGSLICILVSIFPSVRQSNSRPFFLCSGACLFAAIGPMLFELSRGWTAKMINAETMATTMLSGMLCSTFTASLASGMRTSLVYTHVTVTFALCVCLGIGVCGLWTGMARKVVVELDQSKLHAATFAGMHLIASTLTVAEALQNRVVRQTSVRMQDEHRDDDYDRKICAVI